MAQDQVKRRMEPNNEPALDRLSELTEKTFLVLLADSDTRKQLLSKTGTQPVDTEVLPLKRLAEKVARAYLVAP